MSTKLQIAGLIAVSVCTSLVTSQIYGQYTGSKKASRRPRATAANDSATPRGTTIRNDLPHRAAALDPTAVMVRPIAAYHMDSFQIDQQGNDVQVRAVATFHDERPELFFFWTLRVIPVNGSQKPVYNKHYSDQAFRFLSQNADGTMTPAFAERLRLLPGTYRVHVILHSLHPSENVSVLDDEKQGLYHRSLWESKKISIPG